MKKTNPKKAHKKVTDADFVAAKESHEGEVKYISGRWKVGIRDLRKIMLELGKNGKPARSRRVIYAKLREMGYVDTKAKAA